MRILAIEPYFGLSHKTFLEGYKKYSRHEVELWTLPPRKWKWRMRGSAYHFAELANELDKSTSFDCILVSDFLNLADFIAMAPRRFRALPTAVYFHENQITYPLGEHAPTDYHYGWINVSTALCADRVIFNSIYHRGEFFAAVRDVFSRMPDYVPPALMDGLAARSVVLPVGIDFEPHEAAVGGAPRCRGDAPTILWNHRWEYDKGPESFFSAMEGLEAAGADFRLVVCGQSFRNRPAVFDTARERLAHRIDHWGFFEDQAEYLTRVRQCDIVVSTAVHEFFGVSVIEAILLGCLPVLPKRLSYPEILPPHLHPLFLYENDDTLVDFLVQFLTSPPAYYRRELREAMRRYDWRDLAGDLDRELEALV